MSTIELSGQKGVTSLNPTEALEAVDPPVQLQDPALTENSMAVLSRRYLKKHPETGEVIETPRQIFWRVATHIAKAELAFPGGTPEKALAASCRTARP